jgi:hypothetical protein
VKSNGIEWRSGHPDTNDGKYQHAQHLVPRGLIRLEPCALFYQSRIVPEQPHKERNRKTVEQNQEDPAVEPKQGAGCNEQQQAKDEAENQWQDYTHYKYFRFQKITSRHISFDAATNHISGIHKRLISVIILVGFILQIYL